MKLYIYMKLFRYIKIEFIKGFFFLFFKVDEMFIDI